MMRKSLVIGIVAAGILAIAGAAFWAGAEDDDDDNPAVLAKVFAEASIPLEQGLIVSEREGKPISGKFEVEDEALQLSVYTVNGDKFAEVIVDPKSGAIKNAETITDADDLKDAKEQSEAMAKAKLPLVAAVARAVKANSGYRAVSVTPMLIVGQPVAAITLVKGEDVKKVTEKLD